MGVKVSHSIVAWLFCRLAMLATHPFRHVQVFWPRTRSGTEGTIFLLLAEQRPTNVVCGFLFFLWRFLSLAVSYGTARYNNRVLPFFLTYNVLSYTRHRGVPSAVPSSTRYLVYFPLTSCVASFCGHRVKPPVITAGCCCSDLFVSLLFWCGKTAVPRLV